MDLRGEFIGNGLTSLGHSSLCPISFDGSYRVVRRQRSKRKNVKEVKDLGEMGVINPSTSLVTILKKWPLREN